MRKERMDAAGAVLLIGLSALMGFNQVIIKLVNAGMQPTFQAGLRSLCAFFPILCYAWLKRKPLNLNDGSFWPGIFAGLFFAGEFLLIFSALDLTSVSRVSLFFYMMPVWAAVGAHFMIEGDRLTPIRVSGLAVAVAGIVLAFSEDRSQSSQTALLGDVLSLIAGLLWAAIVLIVRTTRLSRSCPEQQLLYQLAVSAVVLLALAPLSGDLIRDMNATIIVLFTVQVVLVICTGFLLWFWVLSIYPASSTASFSFLTPVFGVLSGYLVFGDDLSGRFMLALVLVVIGVLLINRPADSSTLDRP